MPDQQRGRPRGRSTTPPSGSAVIVSGAVLAVLAMGLVITIERRSPADDPGAAKAWVVPPVSGGPETLIPLQSDPPTRAPSSAVPPPTAVATGMPLPVARPSRRVPARLLPEPGSRLSLVAAGDDARRLRHRNFALQLVPVGRTSPAAVRADATFVLRRGLADPACVSLEAVNFPGRFVRHRDFVLVLQPREPSRLFAADATFCPVAAGTGGDFVLRSSNYPDRHLTADGPAVRLSERSAGPAQRFRAAPGL